MTRPVYSFRPNLKNPEMCIRDRDIYEEIFSEFSYGFRPGRSCHDAIKQALELSLIHISIFPVAMRFWETPVHIPNTMVKLSLIHISVIDGLEYNTLHGTFGDITLVYLQSESGNGLFLSLIHILYTIRADMKM